MNPIMNKGKEHNHINCPECSLEIHEPMVKCPRCGSGLVDFLDDDLDELLEEREEGGEDHTGD